MSCPSSQGTPGESSLHQGPRSLPQEVGGTTAHPGSACSWDLGTDSLPTTGTSPGPRRLRARAWGPAGPVGLAERRVGGDGGPVHVPLWHQLTSWTRGEGDFVLGRVLGRPVTEPAADCTQIKQLPSIHMTDVFFPLLESQK